MQRRILTLLVSVCLTSALGGLRVNAERLPVRLYTSADGLGSWFVYFLMSDSRGFMWFCTRDGLSRFDGSRFITYRWFRLCVRFSGTGWMMKKSSPQTTQTRPLPSIANDIPLIRRSVSC
jgi:ligand-binding sensor domain-containing protein